MEIDGVRVELFGEREGEKPIVVMHAFGDEARAVWESCTARDFCLAAILVPDWERTLSPWATPRAFKGGTDFGDGADSHIARLESTLLPAIRAELGIAAAKCYIAGYSFAGLFALYTLYRSQMFAGAASASGSLWFPRFVEFAESAPLAPTVRRVFLSLGDAEKRTKNRTMQCVEENTRRLYAHYRGRGIRTAFELNSGGHFDDAEKRLARGIDWLLHG